MALERPYELDELTANDVLDEIDGLVIRVLDFPKDEHLTVGVGAGVPSRKKKEVQTIWEISCVYLKSRSPSWRLVGWLGRTGAVAIATGGAGVGATGVDGTELDGAGWVDCMGAGWSGRGL